MAQRTPAFDYRRAMANPSAYFAQPKDVLARRGLSRSTKLRLLRQWEQDARGLAVAEAEGMSGGEESMHGRVLAAIQMLEEGGQAGRYWDGLKSCLCAAMGATNRIIQGTREQPVAGLILAATVGYAAGRLRPRGRSAVNRARHTMRRSGG